ncbi:UNVERIFIED_CONTAM: hypothetical protein GTU68_039132 [Idotea baltica]|nr:hypothetical protein [Idotea baltica]
MRAEAIRIANLVVRFGDFTAVDSLNLSIPPGQLFGFLGPNGAGKTTTIRVLTGSQKPTSGTVEVAGCKIPDQFAKAKPLFGYVPDTENHINEFTGKENLELFADLYGVPRKKVDEVLQRLELYDARNVAAGSYSKGMRRKLLIARELLHSPRVLYLDEPTANLDAHSTKLVREFLQELAADGVTIFLTTHNMEEVEQICDRVAILCKGKLVACDSPTRFVTEHAERFVAAQFEREGQVVREKLSMDDAQHRNRLANIIQSEECVSMHSQEFNFQDVFLKITGEVFE